MMHFITLFWTVAFCLGFYLVTQEGFFLYFIREYFERAQDKYFVAKEQLEIFHSKKTTKYYRLKALSFIATPFVLCITCMGSIWGAVWFCLLNGLTIHLLPYLVINCFAASFIQTFIWKLYVKYIL